jgi:hypothetical protein
MADTVGNRLGPRATFEYTSDSLLDYNISLDRSVGLAVGNSLATDADLPVLRASQSRPISPRYVLLALQSNPAVKKRAIVSAADSTLFTSTGATVVSINSVNWIVTGRVGERRFPLRLTP